MAGNNASNVSDETRGVIRRHVMANYMHRERRTQAELNHGEMTAVYEIGGMDPFDAFPVKFEPYMFDLLKYCILPLHAASYRDH